MRDLGLVVFGIGAGIALLGLFLLLTRRRWR